MTNKEFTAKMNGHVENYVKNARQFRTQFRWLAAYILLMSICISIVAALLSVNEGSPILSAISIAMLVLSRIYVQWGNEIWERMMKCRQECIDDRDRTLRICSDSGDFD